MTSLRDPMALLLLAAAVALSATAGYAAAPSPPPPLAASPPNPRLACKKDADCAFVERPCTCPPCGEVWREVMNRKELDKLKATWARRRCGQPVCAACTGHALGTKAVCAGGQCAAR